MFTLPNYIITGEVYEGTEAVIYRGHRSADRSPVIIKVTKGVYPSPRQVARIRREYAITKGLDLENVVKVYALEEVGSGVCLIREDFGGRALSQVIRGRPLDVEPFLRVSIALADALADVHEHHILHKDVKPHNIIVNTDTWQAKLTDFGIAQRASLPVDGTLEHAALEGTLAYMAPEQSGRMDRPIDHRSDLYSLGVTMYEMLTGALPFPASDPVEIVHSHIARTPTAPGEVREGVPGALSDIVMKLLSKAAEDRYQSARSLKADLADCVAQWRAKGAITTFPLGRADRPAQVAIPPKLYGREDEVGALRAAFSRVSRGASELVLLSGPAGIGKTALARAISTKVARGRAYFVSGASDQYNPGVPYVPLVEAFRGLVRQILTEDEAHIARWKERLSSALGPNAQVLVDVVPEAMRLLGPQEPPPELGPAESQNRFYLIIQRFVCASATEEHPLILFLDDLQWCDTASLKLLERLLTDPESAHLLVIGAYRDGEVDAAHPLRSVVEGVRGAGRDVREIALAPLGTAAVREMLAGALHESADDVAPLAAIVLEKTHGNPFFVGQFVATLSEEGMLSHGPQSSGYRADIESIRGAAITDNVVDLMAAKVRRLSPRTLDVMMLAACVGEQFELSTLAAVQGRSLKEVLADLSEAIQEGLVAPVFAGEESDRGTYRFLHNRVRQAVYSRLPDEERSRAHLAIGRFLRARQGADRHDEELFEIAGHLSLGTSGLSDERERIAVAEHHLAAGRRAKAKAAYEAAARYLASGMGLLDASSWQGSYELTYALHRERAECEYLSGHFEEAERLFDVILQSARSDVDRARAYDLRMVVSTVMGKYARALDVAAEALRLFDIELPATEEAQQEAVGAAFAEAGAALAGRPIEDLINAPVLADERQEATLRLLTSAALAAYFSKPTLMALMILRMVTISLRHGHSGASAFAYMVYGLLLANVVGDHRSAYAFGQLALALSERLKSRELSCRLHVMFGGNICYYRVPLGDAVRHMEEAYQAGLETGDYLWLSYACDVLVAFKFAIGEDLGTLQREVDRHLVVMARTKDAMSVAFLTAGKQAIACLQGLTKGPTSLSDGAFDEAAFVARMKEDGLAFCDVWYYTVKLQLFYLAGNHAEAAKMASLAEERAGGSVGAFFMTDLAVYSCLALAALCAGASGKERARYRAEIGTQLGKLRGWAESSPETFLDKRLLVEAEVARVDGDEALAARRYDEAIEAAHLHWFPRVEALANELAGRFYLARGKRRAAVGYLVEAHYGYVRWGAAAKARAMEEEFPFAVAAAVPPVRMVDSQVTTSGTVTSTTRQGRAEALDITTLLRAAHAIAGELVIDRLLYKMMKFVLEGAGAQRGFLLMERDERRVIEASATVDPDEIVVRQGVPLEESSGLAMSVVHYVARVMEPVVLSDPPRDSLFAGDPYIEAHRPKSIFCLPMVHQGQLTGILYLENNMVSGAFTPGRLELLTLLSSQAAIAIENALLYARVHAVTEELRRSNQALEEHNRTLEERIAERTADLVAAHERLQVELSQRERAEEARARLQEEVLRAKEAMLEELSTPMIPVTDRLMVMPLIGAMDRVRAQRVLATALTGVKATGAEVVILDITGVKLVDSDVAASLVGAAQALRLLGAEAVITGVRPEVAQALVSLGVDLTGITTKGTLQSGIVHALGRVEGRARAFRR